MGRNRVKKKAEWKETNLWPFTPKYSYPVSILNRYLFFWGEMAHYRKAINYACELQSPNRICCVYLLGSVDAEKVEKYISDKEGNLLVLFSDSIGESYQSCAEITLRVQGYRATGYSVDNEQSLQKLASDIAKLEDFLQNNPDSADAEAVRVAYEQDKPMYDDLLNINRVYERFNSIWNHGLCAIGCYNGRIASLGQLHMDALTQIAKRVFPLGIEAATSLPLAYKTTKRVAMAASALSGKVMFDAPIGERDDAGNTRIHMFNAAEYYGCPDVKPKPIAVFDSRHMATEKTGINDNAIYRSLIGKTRSIKYGDIRVVFEERQSEDSIAQKLAHDIYEYVNASILETGYANLQFVRQRFMQPPYGFYTCNWYYYVMGAALRRYANGKYFMRHGIHCARIQDIQEFANAICFESSKFYRKDEYSPTIFKQTTVQRDFTRLFRRLFDAKCRDDTFQEAQTKARVWCEKNIQLSCVDIVDPMLYELIGCYSISEIEYGYEKYYDYLKQNFDRMYKALRSADQDMYDWVAAHYGPGKADRWQKYFADNATAKGWLWSKEWIYEHTENYMKQEICRECGKVIWPYTDNGEIYVQTGDGRVGQGYHLSLKDLFALQKKLYGRFTNQYFCPSCLCEDMGWEPEDIRDSITQFKEEGCTLFS